MSPRRPIYSMWKMWDIFSTHFLHHLTRFQLHLEHNTTIYSVLLKTVEEIGCPSNALPTKQTILFSFFHLEKCVREVDDEIRLTTDKNKKLIGKVTLLLNRKSYEKIIANKLVFYGGKIWNFFRSESRVTSK